MANRRFIDFPIASTVGDSDIMLIWQSGLNKQTTKATFLSGLPENLDELNDVAISGLTNGQILRYDSITGKWENTDQGNLDLNDLNDVSIVSPSNGQVLVYNSSTSKWENSSGGYVPYTGAVTTVNLGAQTIQAGQFVKAGGTSAQFLKADGSVDSNVYGTGTVTSVALTMPSAFSVGGSPVTTAGTLAVTGAGTVGQYIRGDGSLADFPESSGGGSSVSYYLNGSVAQGTIGGIAYKELNKVPILGAGTDFTINADGYIASFLTDAGDPNLLEIPGGNWNFETYFSASSGGGSPSFYVELYKYDGTTFTLIASSSTSPELIAFGTNLNPYFSTLAVPTTTLALTDRLAIRYYVTHSGRTITLHTEDNHLCQIVTTFTTGLTSLNGLTAQVQNLAVGTSGTDFNIASATATHTFNLPTASATNRGALSSTDWSIFNNKQNALTNPVTGTGTSGQIAYFTGTTAISSESNLFWDATNDRLGIGLNNPLSSIHVIKALGNDVFSIGESSNNQRLIIGQETSFTGNYINSTNVNLKLQSYTDGGTGGNIIFQTGVGTLSTRVTITNTGASIFTSSITASSFIKSGGTSSQFLKADGSVDSTTYGTGTVTSVGLSSATSGVTIGSTPVTTSGTITLAIATASGSQNGLLSSTDWTTFNNKQNALTNPVTGTGTSGRVAYWNGTNSITSDSDLLFDGSNLTVGGNISTTNGANRFLRLSSASSYFYYLQATNDDFQILEAGSTPRFTIKYPNGNVLIGTTTDSGAKLNIRGSASNYPVSIEADGGGSQLALTRSGAISEFFMGGTTSGATTLYVRSGGSNGVYLAAGGVAWISNSDERLKTDLVPIENGLEKVVSLRSVIGRYLTDDENKKRPFLIAQDVEKVLPESVFFDSLTNHLGVSYSEVIPLLVAAIKEIKQEIDILKN